MKTTLFLLGGLFALGVFDATAQSVTSAQRRAYLIENYNVTSAQAEQYETVLAEMKEQDTRLCDSQVSSQAFKQARRLLIRNFRQQVAAIFPKEAYRVWRKSNQEIDRYNILSNEKLVSPEQLRNLYAIERKWLADRDAVRNGNEAENVKHEREAELLNSLQAEIFRALGTELGEWYFDEKELQQLAYRNMDSYGATYQEAQNIARIETSYKKKRKAVYQEDIKFAQKEEKLFALDDQKAEEVRRAVSQEVADRWFVITKNQLDYTLQKRYGLDKSQITKFKTAYNVYAIEEYRILGDKKMLNADKLQQLSNANRQFCETVQPLFASEAYTRWQGWRHPLCGHHRRRQGDYGRPHLSGLANPQVHLRTEPGRRVQRL